MHDSKAPYCNCSTCKEVIRRSHERVVRRHTLRYLADCVRPMRTDAITSAVANLIDPRGELETAPIRRMLEALTADGLVKRDRLRGRWYYEITDAGLDEAPE
jgi:DNA-binding PadR family transcriptional regulator